MFNVIFFFFEQAGFKALAKDLVKATAERKIYCVDKVVHPTTQPSNQGPL
jgi:hypothetical protein